MSHLLAIAFLLLPAIADGDDPPLKITTKRDNDQVEVKVEKDKATVSIHSPFGISQAIFERSGENWPDVLTIRLNLKGLENLKIVNGKIKLEAAVSSQNGKVRLWMDGKEGSPLNSKNPFWIEIRMIDKDGKPTTSIPLQDGYFEVRFPKALFEDNPKLITVHWIDFYRGTTISNSARRCGWRASSLSRQLPRAALHVQESPLPVGTLPPTLGDDPPSPC